MGSKRKTGRAKYNWPRLKQDFIASDFVEVAPFLRSKNIDPKSGNATRQTNNWGEEKAAIRREAEQEARKQVEAQEYQAILEMKRGFLGIGTRLPALIDQYLDEVSEGEINPKGLRPTQAKALWEMTRTELGLVTRLTRNQFEQKPEPLTDEEIAEMNELLFEAFDKQQKLGENLKRRERLP